MRIIETSSLGPDNLPQSETEKLWIYNGLDCCVTLEVFDAIVSQLDNTTRSTYEFSKSLMGPILELNTRGILVDQARKLEVLSDYAKQSEQLQSQLSALLLGAFDRDYNWRSPQQMQDLFYRTMRLPEVRVRGKVTTNRDALEKLEDYFLAGPIIRHILALRDIGKKIGVLRTEIDPDGRMRTSYNIAGTTTGRLSSSLSDFGTGGNLQNIEKKLRSIFVADEGMKLAEIDLEQAESRLVGALCWNLFNDGRYLDACESGDLHTSVCRLAWSDLDWTGTLRDDKAVAESPFYRQHSYRHMAKVLGHGTNYNGKPYTMAKHTKLDAKIIQDFQSKYFQAFPSIPRWHGAVASELASTGNLTTLTGRRRWFFGRRDDDATVREAIAFNPQGSVGDILNQGLLRVWRANVCTILLQIHDAILIQYPAEREGEIISKVKQLLRSPIQLAQGRIFEIPSDVKVGWNWGPFDEKTNPDGLRGFDPNGETRRRQRPAKTSILDTVL